MGVFPREHGGGSGKTCTSVVAKTRGLDTLEDNKIQICGFVLCRPLFDYSKGLVGQWASVDGAWHRNSEQRSGRDELHNRGDANTY